MGPINLIHLLLRGQPQMVPSVWEEVSAATLNGDTNGLAVFSCFRKTNARDRTIHCWTVHVWVTARAGPTV